MLNSWSKWLFRAENDLDSAQILLKHDQPKLDIAIYLTQQCAEKVLKGFLAFHQQEIPKTHELVKLVDRCMKIDPSFLELMGKANYLTPNATEFRYTDNFDEAENLADLLPEIGDVETSIMFAHTFLIT
ncbi:MAG: HEPN domain-containing protein [Planctomycetaceae bacterium]|jgi:HEPN domain-containing protein|nr:HEPN domain-containing protein [Planctomycetaceae bacterium]